MPEVAEGLAELVESVVEPLIEYPDELEVASYIEEDDSILIEIRVNPDDCGKVIGRQGRVIKSIRTLARAAATRKGSSHVDVELIDE